MSHGGSKKKCNIIGCNKNAQNGGSCISHGGEYRLCKHFNCKKKDRKGGFCQIHHLDYVIPLKVISKQELKIKQMLDKNKIPYNYSQTFAKLKSFKGGYLRFDFRIPVNNSNIFIEFDGIQHIKPVSRFGGKESFIDILSNDLLKDKYCHEKNYPLLRIRYNQISQIEYLITKVYTNFLD